MADTATDEPMNTRNESDVGLQDGGVKPETELLNSDGDEVETEIIDEDPYATSVIFLNTDNLTSSTNSQGKSEKDLNSPDSNDSGIQADAQSFRNLNDDDLELYAVVRKPKGKTAITSKSEDNGTLPEATEEVLVEEESQNGVSSKVDVRPCPAPRRKKQEDPYAMIEFKTADDANEDSAYAAIRQNTRTLRLAEQADVDSEVSNHNANGNHRLAKNEKQEDGDEEDDDHDKSSDASDLPEGWQRHEDEQGSYYWHIKSGITQRDPPSPVLQTLPSVQNSKTKESVHFASDELKTKVKTLKESSEPPIICAELKAKPSRPNVPALNSSNASLFSSTTRFLVRCLGSLPLDEEELTDDKGGKAINHCISSLSHPRPGIPQNGKLQGRDLYLEFCGENLVLSDIRTNSVVRSESVRSVKVWGVGREKESRDFAYIVRDSVSELHMCWVFKCETTGHEVASALRNVCYRILKENELPASASAQQMSSSADHRLNESDSNRLVYETDTPRDLPRNQYKPSIDQPKKIWNGQSKPWNESPVFPVPMSESKKILNCHYLGMMKVPKPLGMDVLNNAIEMIYAGVPSSKWVSVSVEVAPSAVTVYDRGNVNSVIFDCRIRFLTFLGIGINNCRLSAFIMHSAQNEFFAHVFHCIPDAGSFCRTIKAACKLRYQKCLDAQTQKVQDRGKTSRQTSAGSMPPFQGLKESFHKGVSNFFGGNNKKQQQMG